MTEIIYMQSALPALIALFIFIAFLGFVSCILEPRKTKKYRQDLSNLYVAAKIREVAGKENINISEEYESFKKWRKKDKMETQSLDTTIEEELQDKITEGMKVDKKDKENTGE